MAYRSMTDGLVHLLRREAMSKGVRIIPHEEGDISIELHIVVEHGVNIAAVCRSIINQGALYGQRKHRRKASAASTFASTA
ncbi:MAG: Asp23/Gls24 family envelope stress response protein [Oscillibacter sp.]